MRYGMVIDLKRCIGCYGCQIFCRAANSVPPGISWSRVLFYETGKYPKVHKTPLPVLCMHCNSPACVEVCPTGASIKRKDGIVIVDANKCTGCLNCLLVCPYGARHLSPSDTDYFPGQGATPYEKITRKKHKPGVVEKCDFCLERVQQGSNPACVENCMAKARFFGDLEDPQSEVAKLLRNHKHFQVEPGIPTDKPGAESEFEPAVYYLLPDS